MEALEKAWWWLNTSHFGDIAAVVSTLVAIVAAGVALKAAWVAIDQSRQQRDLNIETTAKQYWLAYEERAFNNPQFSDPVHHPFAAFDYRNLTVDGKPELFGRYEWYVSLMILACEEVLRLPTTKDWSDSVDGQLEMHLDYLGSPHFAQYLPNVAPIVKERIERLLGERKTYQLTDKGSIPETSVPSV